MRARASAGPSLLKRALACLLSAAMCVAFTPVVAWGGTGTVEYWGWDTASNTLGKTSYTGSYTEITDSNKPTNWAAGWYVATGEVTIDNIVTVSGDVHLVLADGCELTVKHGIQVLDNDKDSTNGSTNSLTIYGQSTGDNMGSLIATDEGGFNAGIGGGLDVSGDKHNCGTVTINGGTVTATGGSGGAGIGGGGAGDGGSIAINGGTITANGSASGAGIGGGNGGSGGSSGSFSTTDSGNAVVFASSISDKTKQSSWSGVIFEGNSAGTVYGSPTLCSDLTIPDGTGATASYAKTLIVPNGKTLTIASDSTLTIPKASTLTNSGAITNNGKIYVDGTFTDNVTTPTGGVVYYPLTLVDADSNFSVTGDISKPDDTTYGKWGGTVILVPEREGYSVEWSVTDTTNIISTITVADNKFSMPSKAVTISANWKIKQYTITFDTDGGSTIAPITQDYGTAVAAPENPTKTGYTFSSWNEAVPATMPAEDKTLTAQWRINQYTITFDTSGGSAIDPITQDYGSSVTAPADPTRSGYTFAGWDREIPAAMPAEDMTVTAKWDAIYVPPTYSVPASGEGGLAVKVTVSGSTAVVAEISASALEGAAGSGAATVTIDLSGLPAGVTQAQLSKSTVDRLLAVVGDEGNAVESVTVNLGGAVLTVDAKALAAISEQAKGTSVTLGVAAGTADSLNGAQQQALSPFEVVELCFEAQVKCGGAEVHDFGGGTVRVSVALEPRAGHDPARYVVLYVSEDGSIERYVTAWADGLLSFTAPHFSAYAVVYVEDATQAAVEAFEALPAAAKLKTSQAKEAVEAAQAALAQAAALGSGQKMLVDEALVANAQEVAERGAELVAAADEKAVGKVKNKAFSVKAGKNKSIAFKTKSSAAGTKVTYAKSSGSKYITVSKSGKVTAKKGMRAGKTYTAKVKVTCGASTRTVKVTVRAK